MADLYESRNVYTHFGDYLLGLFVTWTSQPSNNEGSSDMTILLQANLRAHLYVYGYDSTLGTYPAT